jgi:DNA-binding NarL/FixJ family response regulator
MRTASSPAAENPDIRFSNRSLCVAMTARGSSPRSSATQVKEASRERNGLTPREQEVLTLLAQGHGTQAISNSLHISPKTVSTHAQRILVKLDVHSRGEVVAFAYREGLVPDTFAHALVAGSRL